MFLTVTLNPALDKTLVVQRNAARAVVRAVSSVDLAGGKGVNVARALLGLGGRVRAFLPLGGHPGAQVAELARAEGMEVAVQQIARPTRTALTVREETTGEYWHYLEPGPELREEELAETRDGFLRSLEGCHTAILSGSLPSPSAAPLLPWMLRLARERGLRVALDSFGPLQRPALEAGPWLAKPNLFELQATLGETLDTDARCWDALERLAGWGAVVAVLSLGAAGALVLAEGRKYRLVPPRVAEVNDLGGGDSMVAGICWAASEGYTIDRCLAWGAACGAANAAVWDPGGIQRREVERLLPEIRVQPR